MGFSQHCDTGNPTVGCEVVHVNMQERGTAVFNAFAEGGFHDVQFSEVFCAPEVNQKVCSRKFQAVSVDEMILGLCCRLAGKGRPFTLIRTGVGRFERLFNGGDCAHNPCPKKRWR